MMMMATDMRVWVRVWVVGIMAGGPKRKHIDIVMVRIGISGEEADKWEEILVVDTRLPSKEMLQRNRVRLNQINHGLLFNDSLQGVVVLSLTFRGDMEPEHKSKVPGRNSDIGPHLSAILIPFISRRCSERDDQTEHGTQNTQECIRDLKLVRGQLRNQGDHD